MRNVVSRAKMVAEISRLGGEWRTCTEIEEKYRQLESMSEKKATVSARIRCNKIVLNTHKIIPKDKKHLFVIKGNTVIQLKNNLKEIVANSPHYEHLSDIYGDETRITGFTMLTSAEREKLVEERIQHLKEKLEKARSKRGRKEEENKNVNNSSVSEEGPPTPQKEKKQVKRKKATEDLNIPDPSELVGRRVDLVFMTKQEGSERRVRTIYTATISCIVKHAKNPTDTLFQTEYDVDCCDEDDDADEEEEVQTIFKYPLIHDYINGDLTLLDYMVECH